MTSTCCPGRSVGGHRLLLCPGSGRGGRPSSVREKGEVGSGPSDDLGGFRAAMLGDVDLSPQKLCGARAPHRDVPGGWWRLAGVGHPLVLPQRSFPLLAPPSAVRRGAAPGTGWLQAGPHLCCGPPTQAPGITGVSGYFPLFINFSFSAIIKILIM